MALPAGKVEDAGSAADCAPATLPGFGHSVFSPEETAHILYERDGKVVQLCISGMHSLAEAAQLFAEVPVTSDRLKAFLQAQEAFHSFLWDKDLPKEFDRLPQRQDRLDLTLKALDGSIAGASQREIAIGIFGIARVEADWGKGHDHLKSQVRRLIKRGHWLTDGGYRTLLR